MADSAILTKNLNAFHAASIEELGQINKFVVQLIKTKRRNEGAAVMSTLQPGDFVKIDNIRPRHMNGARGEVISLKTTKVVVKFPGTQWANGITVPSGCLTKIS